MNNRFLECRREDLFLKEPFVFNTLSKENRIIIIRKLDEILLFRKKVLQHIENNYPRHILGNIKRFLEEGSIPENDSIMALVKTLKTFRDSRFISCLFTDLITRFGLPSPIMLEPGHARLVILDHYDSCFKDSRFDIENFVYAPPRDDYEPIFSPHPVPVHRDMNFPHYTFQVNFWFPFHDLSKENSLMLFPGAYNQNLPSYPQNLPSDDPDDWGYGPVSQIEMEFGDLIIFHSEQFHASPVQDLQIRRLSIEMRLASGCIDDNAVYRKHFWNLNNFLPKLPDLCHNNEVYHPTTNSSSLDRAVSLIEHLDTDWLTLTNLSGDRTDFITSQHYLNVVFDSLDEAITYTNTNNSEFLSPGRWIGPTLLVENINGFNIVGFRDIVYGIPQSDGAFEFHRIKNNNYSCVYHGLDIKTVKEKILANSLHIDSETNDSIYKDDLLLSLSSSFPFCEDRSFALTRILIANKNFSNAYFVLEDLLEKTKSYFWALVASRWLIRLGKFELAKLSLSKAIWLAASSPINQQRHGESLPLQYVYKWQFYPETAIRAAMEVYKQVDKLDPGETSPNILKILDYRVFSPNRYQIGECFSYNIYRSGSILVALPKDCEFDPDALISRRISGVLINESISQLFKDIYSKESSNVNNKSSEAIVAGNIDNATIIFWRSKSYLVFTKFWSTDILHKLNSSEFETNIEESLRQQGIEIIELSSN